MERQEKDEQKHTAEEQKSDKRTQKKTVKKKGIKSAKRSEARMRIAALEGFCETSLALIGELINGAMERTWKKTVPCGGAAVRPLAIDTLISSYNHK